MRLSLKNYPKIGNSFVAELKKHDIHAEFKPEVKIIGNSNFQQLKSLNDIHNYHEYDAVLIISLLDVGLRRDYSGFSPVADPVAFCKMSGKLIDSTTRKTIWYYETKAIAPINTPWEQVPHYSNAVAAMQSAIIKAEQELLANPVL